MIAIGSDHAGFDLKTSVMQYLSANNIEYIDLGTYSREACDYPVYAKAVTEHVVNLKCDKGILICGTGIGMCIAANKVKGIRAALCSDTYSAHATRQHNDANVLVLGARVIGSGLANDIVKTFLASEFSNGDDHCRRISQFEEA